MPQSVHAKSTQQMKGTTKRVHVKGYTQRVQNNEYSAKVKPTEYTIKGTTPGAQSKGRQRKVNHKREQVHQEQNSTKDYTAKIDR